MVSRIWCAAGDLRTHTAILLFRRALLPRAFPDYLFRPTHSPTHQIIEDIPVELRHSVGGALSRRMAISHVFKFSRLFVPQANGLFLFSMHFGTDCTRRKTRRADHATQHLLMFKIFETNRSPTQNPNIPKKSIISPP